MRKKPILEYESAFSIHPDILEPSVKHIPDWYRKIPFWKKGMVNNKDGKTVKQCVPFLDALMTGYVCTLPCDIKIEQYPGEGPRIEWPMKDDLVKTRPEADYDKYLTPEGFSSTHFFWHFPIALRVPKGYSVMVTHPLNRNDLPYRTLTGVVDGDLIMVALGAVPFFISNTFEGVIPKGTPYLQIIPFKQTNWTSVKVPGLVEEGAKEAEKTHSVFTGWYKKTFWTRKEYK